MFVFGVSLSFLVIQCADVLAESVLEDARAYYPIIAVAPAIFFASLMSVFRGYFQGHQTMAPTAISQVVEQFFRVIAVLCMAFLLFPYGLEFAAAGAASGAVFGGAAGLLVLTVFFLVDRKRRARRQIPLRFSRDGGRRIAAELIRLAVPVSFGAVVFPLVQMIDTVIVPSRLAHLGYTTSQATELFGQLSGMAATLISFPTIFTIAISTSLVPAVSEAFSQHRYELLNERLNYGLRAGMVISLPAAAGLFVLAEPICDLLYGSPAAGFPLQPLAFSAVMLGAFQITSSGLQGIGRPQIAMRNLVFTGVLKIIFNYVLTGVAFLNIQGAAIGTVMAFLCGSLLNLVSLKKASHIRYESRRFLRISGGTVLMALCTRLAYYYMVTANIHSHIATVGAIVTGVFLYGVFMLALKEVDAKMLRQIMGK
jgi:stage V sporulation protein B